MLMGAKSCSQVLYIMVDCRGANRCLDVICSVVNDEITVS